MLNTRYVLLGSVVGVAVALALVWLAGTPVLVAAFTGVSASAFGATIPRAVHDGRFPGTRSSVRARRVMQFAYLVIIGSALVGVLGVPVDRTTRFSLQLLVLAVGMAGFNLGSTAALLDADQEADRTHGI